MGPVTDGPWADVGAFVLENTKTVNVEPSEIPSGWVGEIVYCRACDVSCVWAHPPGTLGPLCPLCGKPAMQVEGEAS